MREIYGKYYIHLIAEKVDLLGICIQQHLRSEKLWITFVLFFMYN